MRCIGWILLQAERKVKLLAGIIQAGKDLLENKKRKVRYND